MTLSPLLAVEPRDVFNWILKGLAVLGGAVAGAILAGIIVWSLCKILGARPWPGSARWMVRLLGAAGGGFLAFHLVGGLGGFGFGGGEGSGDGDNKGDDKDKTGEVKTTDVKPNDKDPGPQPTPTKTIRVAVLGDDALKAIQRTEKIDASRCYRIEGDSEKRLLDLKDLKQEIRRQKVSVPLLKVRMVLYLDSPDDGNKDVRTLEEWLRQEELFVPPDKPAKNAEP